jgi:Mn-containing catalase
MFSYHKRLLYPVYVERPDKEFAGLLLQHYWGRESEFMSFTRYIFQRVYAPNPFIRDLMGLIAAEELGHMELIGTAIKKLGGTEYPVIKNSWKEAGNISFSAEYEDILDMIKEDQEAEQREITLYSKHLKLTGDVHIKRMLKFLIDREETHLTILKRSAALLAQEAGNEHFSALIHDYKMSLRIVK